jgi:hypothetical protein
MAQAMRERILWRAVPYRVTDNERKPDQVAQSGRRLPDRFVAAMGSAWSLLTAECVSIALFYKVDHDLCRHESHNQRRNQRQGRPQREHPRCPQDASPFAAIAAARTHNLAGRRWFPPPLKKEGAAEAAEGAYRNIEAPKPGTTEECTILAALTTLGVTAAAIRAQLTCAVLIV